MQQDFVFFVDGETIYCGVWTGFRTGEKVKNALRLAEIDAFGLSGSAQLYRIFLWM